MNAAPSWRRLAAFGADYLAILLYMGVLATVMTTVMTTMTTTVGAPLAGIAATPRQAQLLGFVTLTLPVGLYFAVAEGVFGATVGKRLLGLRVTNSRGARLSPGRSLLRSTVKFLPWELGHTAVHCLVFWTAAPEPLSAPQLAFLTLFYALSLGLAASFLLSLFVGSRRPLYDRVAGSRVQPLHPLHFPSRRLV